MKSIDTDQFEARKQAHIQLALDPVNQAAGLGGLDAIQLRHEALPDCNFDVISIGTQRFNQPCATPFLISSMTAGHPGAMEINHTLATVCGKRGWIMGVGSQRRELSDKAAANEWKLLRKNIPNVSLLANIGLSQVITTPVNDILRLADSVEAIALIVHTNPLQEVIQPEGTPQFKGGLTALKQLCRAASIPVVLKETGCGISVNTLERLKESGLAAVDISGLGGTHWGRIEGARTRHIQQQEAAKTFASWGIPTAKALIDAAKYDFPFEIWASGGLRHGLDAAKCLALGATTVGFAKVMLTAAIEGEEALDNKMATIEYELKTAMFCTGSTNIRELREDKWW